MDKAKITMDNKYKHIKINNTKLNAYNVNKTDKIKHIAITKQHRKTETQTMSISESYMLSLWIHNMYYSKKKPHGSETC